ncbi:hypothetical protein F5Y04DRAFT_261011 [Hypomontagnella monticulosa]|nr:hypothetical protein F5Y04DRAFT_261011 [Hypomontagnella monticulosa]
MLGSRPIVYPPNIPFNKIQNILLVFGSKKETSQAIDWLVRHLRMLHSLKNFTFIDVASFLDFQNDMTKPEGPSPTGLHILDALFDENPPNLFGPNFETSSLSTPQQATQLTSPETQPTSSEMPATSESQITQQPLQPKMFRGDGTLRMHPMYERRNIFLDLKSSTVDVSITPIGLPPNIPRSLNHVTVSTYDRSYVPTVPEWGRLLLFCGVYKLKLKIRPRGIYHDGVGGKFLFPARMDFEQACNHYDL